MEFIGLAASLSSLLALCTSISRAVYIYPKGTKVISEAIQSLRAEIDLLFNFIKTHRSFKDPSHYNAHRFKSQVIRRYANDAQQSINDCEIFLKLLEKKLTEFIRPKGCIIFAADGIIKQIDSFSREVSAHRQTLSLHFNQIILWTITENDINLSRRLNIMTTGLPTSSSSVNINSPGSTFIDGIPEPPEDARFAHSHPETNNFLDLTQHAVQRATIRFHEGDYENDQKLLEKLLEQSEAIYNNNFNNVYEIIELLATSYRRRGQWDKLENLMQKLSHQNYDISLTGNGVFGAFLSLAEIAIDNGQLDMAEFWCHRAVENSKKSHGDQSLLYYRSVSLLIEILEGQKRHDVANSYQMKLYDDSFLDYVYRGDNEKVELLLESRNMSDDERDTALIVAAHIGHEHIARALLKQGADVKTKDKNGCSVSMIAATKRFDNIVKLLLKNGADVNVRNSLDETSMMLAARNGDEKTMQVLLEEGADAGMQSQDGMTTLNFAQLHENKNIVSLLKKQKRLRRMRCWKFWW